MTTIWNGLLLVNWPLIGVVLLLSALHGLSKRLWREWGLGFYLDALLQKVDRLSRRLKRVPLQKHRTRDLGRARVVEEPASQSGTAPRMITDQRADGAGAPVRCADESVARSPHSAANASHGGDLSG
jgi:hypothetical protein